MVEESLKNANPLSVSEYLSLLRERFNVTGFFGVIDELVDYIAMFGEEFSEIRMMHFFKQYISNSVEYIDFLIRMLKGEIEFVKFDPKDEGTEFDELRKAIKQPGDSDEITPEPIDITPTKIEPTEFSIPESTSPKVTPLKATV